MAPKEVRTPSWLRGSVVSPDKFKTFPTLRSKAACSRSEVGIPVVPHASQIGGTRWSYIDVEIPN